MFNNSREGEVNRLGSPMHLGSRIRSYKGNNKRKRTITAAAILAVMFVVTFFALIFQSGGIVADAESGTSGMLKDGSFENFAGRFTSAYTQLVPTESDVWKTTAAQGKMELLRTNKSTYISGVTVKPRDGEVAAELNADEESSLYQIVDTEPSSLYEWGISHAARTPSDTMALIIGPNQDVAPSKNIGEGYDAGDLVTLKTGNKYGRDQMMQMVAWLKARGIISNYENEGLANGGRPIVLYSKKFDEDGSFKDNADNQPFSMTPSKLYTERWCIWVITDKPNKDSSNNLIWKDYGLNARDPSEELDLSEYYLYSVPSGQSKTIFAFTSIENKPTAGMKVADPTFGNFLDGVNFRLYRLLSGISTDNGSATVKPGEGSSSGHLITSDSGVETYVQDGESLTIKAKIDCADKDEVSFAGVYCTIQNTDGSGTTKKFIPVTEEGWTRHEDSDKNVYYTRTITNVKSAIDLHFVFVRSPRVVYDSNGGKPYDCEQIEKADATDPDNVYSFKPIIGEGGAISSYIYPYTSHAAEGQNEAWKFIGWRLFDNEQTYDELFPAVHKVAFNNGSDNKFLVINGSDSFKGPVNTESGIRWETDVAPLYDKQVPGLSFIAQWRWRQTFIPKTDKGSGYSESDDGGYVEVTSVAADNPNYESSWTDKGAKAYYAETNEQITVKATARDGYYFSGWFDADGNQVTLSNTLTYTEKKEGVNTYYAHFIKEHEQRFIRQIKVDGVWSDLGDDDASEVELLDHTTLYDVIGSTVTSTAANNQKYSFVGWYNSSGNKVPESMIINSGKTIRYIVTGDATYYARFERSKKVNFKLQYINADGTLSTPVASDKNYGKLIPYAAYGAQGTVVSSKAYPAAGYQLVGWYDGEGTGASLCTGYIDPTDSRIIQPEVTDTDGVTYYARIKARTDTKYTVEHYFRNWKGATDGKYTKVVTNTYYGTTGETVTPALLALTNGTDYEGYRYESGVESKAINAAGSTVFKIYYVKDSTELTYDFNKPSGVDDSEVSGSVDSQRWYVGYDVIVKDNAFTITGYTFNGWNTKADGSGTSYSKGDPYTLLADVDGVNPNVLYAQWIKTDTSAKYKIEHYKVNADGSAATLAGSEEQAGNIGSAVTAAAKTYSGYTYKPDYDNGEMKTVASGNVLADGSLVLKLYYTPDADKLIYKANGGTPAASEDGPYAVGKKLTVKDGGELFSRPGYTFTGWKTPGGTSYAAGSSYTLTAGEDVLIAQWKANTDTQYTVYHYLVSEDGLSASLADDGTEIKKGTTGATVTAAAKAFTGYKYNETFDSNGMKTVSTGVIAGDGSLVLKLYYTLDPAKLIYDSNGGVESRYEVNGLKGTDVTVQANMFTRPGYKFIGWNTSSDGTGVSVTSGSTYTLVNNENILYAQWSFDVTQCADDMYFQKVWIDSEGNLVDYNKTGADSSSDGTPTDQVKTSIEVSSDGGATWHTLDKKYNSSGVESPVTADEMYITKGPNKLFSGLTEKKSKVQWVLPVLKDNWHLPKKNAEGASLQYRIVEDESSLPEGWKQYTGTVDYASSGASFTNPVTGAVQTINFFSYDESHKVKKQDYQNNFFIINYDERKPASLTVNKIDGDNSTELNKVPVEGAHFELYEKSESGSEFINYGSSVIACKKVGDERQTTLAGGGTAAQCTFAETLERGHEYYLVETKAPTGYRKLDEPVKIEVNATGETALIDGAEKHIISNVLSIELANYLTLTMPTSGMSMTGRRYILTGLAIMIISLVLLVSRKHRAKIRDNKGGER